jgi:hypothetical protein
MNRSFAILIVFLTLCNAAMGSPTPPLDSVLRGGQNIYLVKVASSADGKANFLIVDILRGKSQELTNLTFEPGYDFKPKSEWILISTGDHSNGNNIDDGFYGNFAWFPLKVTRENGKVMILGIGTQDSFKELLQKNPYKS